MELPFRCFQHIAASAGFGIGNTNMGSFQIRVITVILQMLGFIHLITGTSCHERKLGWVRAFLFSIHHRIPSIWQPILAIPGQLLEKLNCLDFPYNFILRQNAGKGKGLKPVKRERPVSAFRLSLPQKHFCQRRENHFLIITPHPLQDLCVY